MFREYALAALGYSCVAREERVKQPNPSDIYIAWQFDKKGGMTGRHFDKEDHEAASELLVVKQEAFAHVWWGAEHLEKEPNTDG